MKTLGLYVHIPFCVRKCRYCDFLSAPGTVLQQENYVQALLREIDSEAERCREYSVRSVFFGGGTPSLLTEGQFSQIARALTSRFRILPDAEWTVEANPGTLTREKVRCWKQCGVNRVSLGMQSADEACLQMLGRIHRMEQVCESVSILKEEGIPNFNLDLMMGLPLQERNSWQETLKKAAALEPMHLSCYSLILEEGTPLADQAEKGEISLPDEETERDMYAFTRKYLSEMGYYQYEISNFARPGAQSSHNLSYWDLSDYLGFGLGASSLLDGKRLKNETDLLTYIQAEDPSELRKTEEVLGEKEAMEEWMFLGFRKTEGVSQQDFFRKFGCEMDSVYASVLDRLQQEGLITCCETDKNDRRWFLTDRGMDLANVVFEAMLLEE